MLKELYNKKLRYNCSYYELKSEIYSNLLIIFLGTSDFIIVNNFFGVVAIGKRGFNFDKEQALYTYQLIENSIHISRIEQLIKTYEAKRLKIKNVLITRKEAF